MSYELLKIGNNGFIVHFLMDLLFLSLFKFYNL